MTEAAHLDDATLLALVEGELRGADLDEVDAHLDSCAPCRDLVATLASGPRAKASERAIGDRVGRFTLEARLGEGAMGAVWEAHDPELDRRVALKLLHAGGADATARARLVREAQAMASLSHPNVVQVYEVGTEGDEVHLVMERVRGASLRSWLAERRSPEAILTVFREAGRGLAAAHDAGLVHRDFKPDNVLVDTGGHAKIGDFGLARVHSDDGPAPDEAAAGEVLTRTGALLGTPAYMAPEQLAGEPAGARADQYAFAVALWEALSGERPFGGAPTVGALREAAAAGPPEPPAAIPARLAPILRRALDPDPSRRFDDVRSLVEALAPPRRARWRAGLAVAAALVGAGLVFTLRPEPEPVDPCAATADALGDAWSSGARAAVREGLRGPVDAWVRRWREARVDACEATHVRHEQSEARLDARVRCMDRQRAAFGAVREALSGPSPSPDALDALPDPSACALVDGRVEPPPPSERAALEALEDRLAQIAVRVAAADPVAPEQAAAAVEEAEAIGYRPTLARARLVHARALSAAARTEDAVDEGRAALFAAEATNDDRTSAEAWLTMARAMGTAGRASDAAETLEHAAAAIVGAGEPADLSETHLRLRGVARTALGDYEGAAADLERALTRMGERLGADSPQLAPVHTSMGNLARLAGRFDDALAAHERALELDRAAWGADHPRVGRDHHNVAGILRRLSRTAEAREHYLRALEVKRAALGDDHPEVGLTLNSLGLLAMDAGDMSEAEARWNEARQVLHGHGDEALAQYNLALLAARRERWGAARDHATEAIAIDGAHLGPDTKRVGVAHLLRGRAHAHLGERDEARRDLERAAAIGERVGDVPLLDEARSELAALEPRGRRSTGGRTEAPAPEPPPAAPMAEPEPAPAEPAAPPIAPRERPTGSGVYGGGRAWE